MEYYKEQFLELEPKYIKEQSKSHRYEQCFEDIKKICKDVFEECGIPEDYFKRNNYSWKQHQIKALTCRFDKILQKIREVENE